jgi:hypothetical protein
MYALFAGSMYYPEGGWGDHIISSASRDGIRRMAEKIQSKNEHDWWHIIDCGTGRVIEKWATDIYQNTAGPLANYPGAPHEGYGPPEREKVSGWRPIETAPKDGSWILAHGPYRWDAYDLMDARTLEHALVGPAVIRWDASREYNLTVNEPEGAWVVTSGNPYTDLMVPLFWMPIPEILKA